MRYCRFGIVVWLIGQMMINVGMVLALLPVIGIPLPLVSYGGSALLPVAGRPRPAGRLRPPRARGRPAPWPPRSATARPACRPGRVQPVERRTRLDPMRVLLAGGGTAGHTSPLLATADALRRLDPDVEITCLGTPRGLETRVVPEAGYPLELIPPVPLPRRPGADLLRVPGAAARPRSRRPWRSSTGSGPTSSSASAATSRCRPTSPPAGAGCPLVVHEQNALPGLANKLGARFTTRVAVSFPDTAAAAARSTSACRSAG